MKQQTVKQYMTRNPVIIDPECTVEEAATKMEKIDCGIFPVGTIEKPVGMVTNRDLVVRALAKKKAAAKTKISEIMTKKVFSIPEDATIEQAADTMRSHQVSRLLVKDSRGKITGILSLGHFVRNAEPSVIAQVVAHTMGKKAA